jgi:hypothetical protein
MEYSCQEPPNGTFLSRTTQWNIPVNNHQMEHSCQEPPNGTFLSSFVLLISESRLK